MHNVRIETELVLFENGLPIFLTLLIYEVWSTLEKPQIRNPYYS
jgi:hypothetical protein